MRDFNLRDMAIEILHIDQSFYNNIVPLYHKGVRQSDYELYTFEQLWGNTSGGFEGMGGSAMTVQRTYVFVPKHAIDNMCLVYFGGAFGYTVPISDKFMDDVKNQRINGKSCYREYFK